MPPQSNADMKSEESATRTNSEAREYEHKWEKYLRHTHEQFLKRIITGPGELILDVSGGTGLLAEELIASGYPFGRLVVNDPAEEMLNASQNRLEGDSRVSFTSHLAHELPYKNEQFDRLLCLNAFHFYTEQEQVMQCFWDLLKPGGRLYLLDWNRSGLFRIVNRMIQWIAPEYINTRSLAELTGMAKKCGFMIESGESWYWRYWNFLFLEARKIEHG